MLERFEPLRLAQKRWESLSSGERAPIQREVDGLLCLAHGPNWEHERDEQDAARLRKLAILCWVATFLID